MPPHKCWCWKYLFLHCRSVHRTCTLHYSHSIRHKEWSENKQQNTFSRTCLFWFFSPYQFPLWQHICTECWILKTVKTLSFLCMTKNKKSFMAFAINFKQIYYKSAKTCCSYERFHMLKNLVQKLYIYCNCMD